MEDHWYEATYVLETLVLKAAHQDQDGMDLFFTSGSVAVKGGKTWADFKPAMNSKHARPMRNVQTDMNKVLGNFLGRHIQTLKKAHTYGSAAKNLTLIILTDGLWAGGGNKGEVEDK